MDFGQKRTKLNMTLDGEEEYLEWKDAIEHKIDVILLDDDFSKAIDGSGYVVELDFKSSPFVAQKNITDLMRTEFLQQSTIKVCIISLAFYIPSHDMLVSILMEIRFEESGMVRTRSFEVLPF